MRSTPIPTRCVLALLAAPLWLTGCAEGPVKPDPAKVAALQERFVLEVEPADALSPLDWREQQTAEEGPVEVSATLDSAEEEAEASDDGRAVFIGRVGGMPDPFEKGLEPNFPWRDGKTVFFLVDAATADEFTDHLAEQDEDHAANCPFCAAHAANKLSAVATVIFPDESDEAASIDARDVFGLKEGELVVVRGEPTVLGDLLVVKADGLFRRE
ncbi:hypothetical protein MalM25_36580 [Planctomycetes bacterium MalM25]|nr:hypothetical protein MalM25_36580 [Planctomycetes bacterium MalM25]